MESNSINSIQDLMSNLTAAIDKVKDENEKYQSKIDIAMQWLTKLEILLDNTSKIDSTKVQSIVVKIQKCLK